MRRHAIHALVVSALFLAGFARAGEAKITYLSGATVYVDAGSDAGIAVGSILEVIRDGAVVARLRVDTVTAKRASATPEGESPQLQVGETVRFAAAAATAGETAAAAPTKPEAPAYTQRASKSSGVHGRIGARYLAVRDRSGIGQDFSQPAIDVRISGASVGGAPFDFLVDARPRRTYRTRADGSTNDTASNRIYSLMGAWHTGPVRLAAGRQMNPSLGPVTLFDGILGEYRNPRFAAGLFAGSEPDPSDYAYDGSTKDFGLYAEGSSAPGAKARWWINGGYLTSTTEGEINRDVMYLSGRIHHGGLFGYLFQQVDFNRGWRKDAEGSSVTWSGSYVALRYRWASNWSVNGGLDSRRNVRVYRDFITPTTTFDDTYRRGYWAGVEWAPEHWLVGLEGRSSSGGTAGSADAYTLWLGALRIGGSGVDVRLRATDYSGPYVEGDLAGLSVSFDLGSRVRLDAHGELRDETTTNLFAESTRVTGIGTGIEVQAGRRTFATFAYDRTTGGEEDNDQLYTGLTWRF